MGELFNKEERQNLSRVVVRRSKIVLKKFLGQNFSIKRRRRRKKKKREKKFTKFLRSQEFQIIRIQSQKDVFKTNIVVIHNQIPHISLTNPSFLPSRRHPTRHRSALFFISLFLSSETNNPHVVLFLMISHVTFKAFFLL